MIYEFIVCYFITIITRYIFDRMERYFHPITNLILLFSLMFSLIYLG